ncbi:MAG: HAD-IIIC family phosphatase [Halanaerobiales bacterium]|nr:HAD-IIIC family phosphatase [Halanaerobiales bacterium]
MSKKKEKEIKCVVWDLDNTLWDGILTESDNVNLKPGIEEILKTLDDRGILNSIASKNNHNDAMRKLKEFNIDNYFLYPEINWNAKSSSIAKIRGNLNIGMDTILFIDDQPFEREEVLSAHKEIMCMDAAEYQKLIEHPRLNPQFITTDSKRRRLMYLEDMKRKNEEVEFEGPKEEFLSTLKMKFVISEAKNEDLQRAEELTVRTNQLNATGRTYSYDELNMFRQSPDYKLLVCELTDKYGSYGKIGIALVELHEDYWHLKLLLMSCRVMSRGVGTVLMTYILNEAKKANVRLLADFVPTERNRMMYITYKFANFNEIQTNEDGSVVMENDFSMIQPFPKYIEVKIPEETSEIAV